jgi:MoaA/NifB/PqqE/SkfB family radical SAM enzyme
MSNLIERIRNRFKPVETLPPGLYAYKAPLDAPVHYRLHLRIEPDGRGVLVVNGSTVLHLNQTAAEYAYYLVKGTPVDKAAELVADRYRVGRDQARRDYHELVEQIETLVTTPDLDPVTYLDFERHEPYSGDLTAPYRLDCALTYRLPEDTPPESAPTDRVDQELTTAEWKAIIDKAWDVGIPHLTFTGGEPTLRPDLVELLEHAEANGQVTGLLTNGRRLSDSGFLDDLIRAGLDHVLIILEPNESGDWEWLSGFQYWSEMIEADLFIGAHMTITPENADQVEVALQRLSEFTIHAVSLSASSDDVTGRLAEARNRAAELDLDLIWDLPVPYSALNPVALETESGPQLEGAGRAWLYIEPDGDVLPTQGVNRVIGNILHDPWDDIWRAAHGAMSS